MTTFRRLHLLAQAFCTVFVVAAMLALAPAPVAAQQAAGSRNTAQAAPRAPAQQQAAPQAAQPAAAGPSYRLAPGDTVKISVFQAPELSVETRLTEAGSISYPLLGTVQLGGLTSTEGEQRIADALKRRDFIKNPQVTLLVTTVRGHQVTVLGQVGRPGRYPLETGDVKLTELLATAGGVLPAGADEVVVVGTRNGKPFRAEVDLPNVYKGGRNADVVLQNGDSIYVDRAPQVYVEGEVGRPGAVRLERGMTVRQAVASAGGITLRGTERGMSVHRKSADGKATQVLPVKMTDPLQADDVLQIKESLF